MTWDSVLLKNGRPVANVAAKDNNQSVQNATADTAQVPEPDLNLSIDLRVILRTNLWICEGLVNGRRGTVRDILHGNGQCPPTNMPAAIMVVLDKYSGPCLNGTNLFPVTAFTRTFTVPERNCYWCRRGWYHP